MLDWDQAEMDESITTEFAGAIAFLDETSDAAHVFSFGARLPAIPRRHYNTRVLRSTIRQNGAVAADAT